MEEFCIEVDENNKKIGLRPHRDFFTGKYIHRGAHLLLFNSKNEILIHKRTHTKKWYPNTYHFSASGTIGNETYEDCINREMREELGIQVPCNRLFIFKNFRKTDKAFHAVFTANSDDDIIPDKREMSEIKWISPDKLLDDINSNPNKYTPSFIKGMKIFFEKYGDKANTNQTK